MIRDGLCNFDHLTLRHRHGAHDPMRIDVNAEFFKNGLRVAEHFALVDDEAGDLWIAAEPQIIHDRPLESLIQFLMHHGWRN